MYVCISFYCISFGLEILELFLSFFSWSLATLGRVCKVTTGHCKIVTKQNLGIFQSVQSTQYKSFYLGYWFLSVLKSTINKNTKFSSLFISKSNTKRKIFVFLKYLQSVNFVLRLPRNGQRSTKWISFSPTFTYNGQITYSILSCICTRDAQSKLCHHKF